jgi:hypothetical protein
MYKLLALMGTALQMRLPSRRLGFLLAWTSSYSLGRLMYMSSSVFMTYSTPPRPGEEEEEGVSQFCKHGPI